MAQYINREKLLKRMEGYCEANCGCKPYEDALCPSCGLGDAIYMVEEQRIVNSKNMRGRKDATVALSKMEKTTRWIPVTERLPNDRRDVQITVFWHDAWRTMYGYYDGAFWHLYAPMHTEVADVEVIGWMEKPAPMPLPEPPKEESNGV